jgi:hypothetical protein
MQLPVFWARIACITANGSMPDVSLVMLLRGAGCVLVPADVLLVAPFRAKPSARIQRAAETITGVTPPDEEEDEERFVLPPDARPWERRLAAFLQHKVQLPELALVWLWTIGPHRIAVLVLVLLGARVRLLGAQGVRVMRHAWLHCNTCLPQAAFV